MMTNEGRPWGGLAMVRMARYVQIENVRQKESLMYDYDVRPSRRRGRSVEHEGVVFGIDVTPPIRRLTSQPPSGTRLFIVRGQYAKSISGARHFAPIGLVCESVDLPPDDYPGQCAIWLRGEIVFLPYADLAYA